MSQKGNIPATESAAELCRQAARQHDFERYVATLFAPRRSRKALWTLLAFNIEIARIREVVSEPMIGQLRLQWWREAIEAAVSGGPVREHFVVEPLTAAIRQKAVAPDLLGELIDGRERDLDDTPIPDEAALLDYADHTGGAVLLAMGRAIDEGAPKMPLRALGRGWALTGILRAVGFHADQGRQLLPRFNLQANGAGPHDVLKRRGSEGVRNTVAEVAALARSQFAAALRYRGPADRLFVLKTAAGDHLKRLAADGFDPFAPAGPSSNARTIRKMLAAHWLGQGL